MHIKQWHKAQTHTRAADNPNMINTAYCMCRKQYDTRCHQMCRGRSITSTTAKQIREFWSVHVSVLCLFVSRVEIIIISIVTKCEN